ncbi:sigma-70 family RNA polymerase sigma factor, partial [Akkermansia muciniphila]
QYADELGVYRNAVHVRKIKVLKKLKLLLES